MRQRRHDQGIHRKRRPRGWGAGIVVGLFISQVSSTLLSAAEHDLSQIAWYQWHLLSVFGSFLAWMSLLVPATLISQRFSLNLFGADPHRRVMSLLLVSLVAAGLLILQGHGMAFVSLSELGAILAICATVYWRGVFWALRPRPPKWLSIRG